MQEKVEMVLPTNFSVTLGEVHFHSFSGIHLRWGTSPFILKHSLNQHVVPTEPFLPVRFCEESKNRQITATKHTLLPVQKDE